MTNLQIAKLYLAANPTADAATIDAAVVDTATATATLATIATTNEAFLNAAYQATFGRTADAEGLAYWGDILTAGTKTQTEVMDSLIAGAEAYTGEGYTKADGTTVIAVEEDATLTAEVLATQLVAAQSKATAEAAADSTAIGATVVALVAVVDAATAATAVVTIDAAEQAVVDAAAAGETFTLTTDDDSLIGTAANDTFNGTTTTLSADDRLLDSSIIDSDTLNLTLTSDVGADGIDATNIETINLDWNSYGTADIDLGAVTGATVNMSSTKSGYLGNANFTNAQSNNITTGAGIIGDLSVTAMEDATIDAGVATSLTMTAGDRTITAKGNSLTTVSITTADDVIISDVAAMTDLTLAAIGKTANVTFSNDTDVDLTGQTASTGELTFSSTADVQLDIADSAGSIDFETLTIAGDNAITLSFANAVDLDGAEVINAGVVKIESTVVDGGIMNLENVAATSFVLEAIQADVTEIVTVTGAKFTLEETQVGVNDIITFVTTTADKTTSDVITVTTEKDMDSALDFWESADEDFETVNIIADATVVADAVDITFLEIIAGNVAANDANKIVLTSASNDVTITDYTASEVDASGVAGNLIITAQTSSTDFDTMVVGGQANNTVDFDGIATTEATFIGNETSDGNDIITFDTTDADAVAVVQGGSNTVNALALTTGQVTVIAGDGNDTVNANTGGGTMTKATLSLDLGAGNNSLNYIDAATTGTPADDVSTISMTTGNGDDTVTITGDTVGADEITLTLGTGTDTLTVTGDITDAVITQTGLDILNIGANGAGLVVDAALLDAQTLEVKADGAAPTTDLLAVVIEGTDTDVDFSNITINRTVDYGMLGLDITAKAGVANSITATSEDDVITGGTGVDTIVFAETGALNGSDTITIAAGTGKDILDFTAFGLTSGEFLSTAILSDATADVNITNQVILFDISGNVITDIDETSEVAALIDGASDALAIDDNGKAIIVSGDASGANSSAYIFMVDDSLDGVAGTLSTADVVLVGTTATNLDLDTLIASNFIA